MTPRDLHAQTGTSCGLAMRLAGDFSMRLLGGFRCAPTVDVTSDRNQTGRNTPITGRFPMHAHAGRDFRCLRRIAGPASRASLPPPGLPTLSNLPGPLVHCTQHILAAIGASSADMASHDAQLRPTWPTMAYTQSKAATVAPLPGKTFLGSVGEMMPRGGEVFS